MSRRRQDAAYFREYNRRPEQVARRARLKLQAGELRHALDSASVMSQREVAGLLGISQQAVQQIERRAILKLRVALRQYRDELLHAQGC